MGMPFFKCYKYIRILRGVFLKHICHLVCSLVGVGTTVVNPNFTSLRTFFISLLSSHKLYRGLNTAISTFFMIYKNGLKLSFNSSQLYPSFYRFPLPSPYYADLPIYLFPLPTVFWIVWWRFPPSSKASNVLRPGDLLY